MRNPNSSVRRVLLLSLGVSILTSTACYAPASAISVLGKKSSASFDLPTAEKLEGDTTQDAANNPDLAPMKLSDDKPAEPASTASGASTEAGSDDGTLNASVTENSFMPKGPLEGDAKALTLPQSVRGSKIEDLGKGTGGLLEQAKVLNLAPLPLMESTSESARKADDAAEIEREQLTSLWEATLAKSPDINFVLQKLMPNSDPSKATTILMRALSTAMYGGMAVVPMAVPNAGAGAYAIQSFGYSTIGQLLNLTDSNAQKKARITQTEQIMLYNMIRDNADKLVVAYRDYKTKHGSLFKANADFEDLKALVPEVKKDGAKELEVMYTLKKQQRDIDEIGNLLGSKRKFLVDMAGEDAVMKLDASIDEEFKKLHPELGPQSAVADESTKAAETQTAEQPPAVPATPAPDNTHKVADDPTSKSPFKVPL